MSESPLSSTEREAILAELATLSAGSIVCRSIRGKKRYYHQWREGGQTRSRYLSADEVLPLRLQIERRKELKHRLTGTVPGTKTGTVPGTKTKMGTVPSTKTGTVPGDAFGHLYDEIAVSANNKRKRDCFENILNFIRQDGPSRFLVIKGPRGAGKLTLVRQLIGKLTPSERAHLNIQTAACELGTVPVWAESGTVPMSEAGTVPMQTVDLTEMRYAEYCRLFPNQRLEDFLLHGGLAEAVFTDTMTARDYVSGVAGSDAWSTLAALTIPFLIESLRPHPAHHTAHSHERHRESSDFQKVTRRLAEIQAERTPDANLLLRLRELRFLSDHPSETLRPDFNRKTSLAFVHPGLRSCVIRQTVFDLMEDSAFAALGAAERKLIRDTVLADAQEHILEEVVLREACGLARDEKHAAVQLILPSGRNALVIADREELVCEMFVVRNEEPRRDEQLEDLTDYRVLDAIEHRYGLITERTVLYRGRNARHPTGIAYKNVEKFLLDL